MSADTPRLELQADTASLMTESRLALFDSPSAADALEPRSFLPTHRAVGDVLLGLGFAVLVLGAGLWPFPIAGPFGVAAMVTALAVLIAAGFLSGAGPHDVAPARRMIGLVLFVTGLVGMLLATGHSATVAHARALHLANELPWSAILLWGPLASFTVALGLGLRSGWSTMKVFCWSMIGFEVCPAAVAVCNRLATALPLGA